MSEFETGQEQQKNAARLLEAKQPKPEGKEYFDAREALILAQRKDGVRMVTDIVNAMEQGGEAQHVYLMALLERNRAYYVFFLFSGYESSDDHEPRVDLPLSLKAELVDAAILGGHTRDVISSWEDMSEDLLTAERLGRLREAILDDARALERFDERFPNIQ